MRSKSVLAAGLALTLGLSGCATMGGKRWSYCAVAGGVLGAGIGGGAAGGAVNAYEGGKGNDGSHEETAAAAAGGAVAGAIVGTLLGHLICDPEESAPPPPPPAAPPPPPAPTPKKTSMSADAFFDFNKATLKPAGEDKVDGIISSLKSNSRVNVLVEGHTDSVGSDAYNQRLSERRAKAVRDYMVSQGIESSRITTRGHGESKPVASNTSAEGRAQNRRVEITEE